MQIQGIILIFFGVLMVIAGVFLSQDTTDQRIIDLQKQTIDNMRGTIEAKDSIIESQDSIIKILKRRMGEK